MGVFCKIHTYVGHNLTLLHDSVRVNHSAYTDSHFLSETEKTEVTVGDHAAIRVSLVSPPVFSTIPVTHDVDFLTHMEFLSGHVFFIL